MDVLLRDNVKRACRFVEDKPLFEFESSGFSARPIFESDPLRCLQEKHLGFYVLPYCAASLFRSVNFIVAARQSLHHGLFAPSVAMAYSASYHLLGSLLALNRRFWLDEPSFKYETKTVFNGGCNVTIAKSQTDPVVAVLSRNNGWIYQRRTRAHKGRWNDLANLFTSRKYPIQKSFQNLFSYMYRGRYKHCDDLLELITNREKYCYEIREVLQDFLGEIPKVRHISLYTGFGGDPGVNDALWNRDLFDASLLDIRAEAFVVFALQLLDEVSSDFEELLQAASMSPDLREKVTLRMHYPYPLDDPKIGLLPKTSTRQRVDWIWNELGSVHRGKSTTK